MKLNKEFYNRNTLQVSKELLGKTLVHMVNGKKIAGEIVEVEAYMGINDKGAHAYGGKMTERTKTLYKEGGTSYIYFVYGMHYCFNVVTREIGVPEAVLIRAIKPTDGLDEMARYRFNKEYSELTEKEIMNLANGPAKLCQAMNLTKKENGENLMSDIVFLEDSDKKEFEIVESKRIGIDYAEEAKDYLWRFYIKGSKYISKK